nr:MAG TPA: putative membrane protein [Caudoviricetes sp.]
MTLCDRCLGIQIFNNEHLIDFVLFDHIIV